MSGSRLAQLVGILRGRSAESGRYADPWAQLQRARAAVQTWKQRAAEAEKRGRRVRQKLVAAVRDFRVVRQELLTARRESPSVALAASVFAHRVHTIRPRTDSAAADRRERRLLDVSPAYQSNTTTPAAIESVATHSVVDGLSWWVPGRTAASRIPYRVMLQTREVALGGIMLDIGANIGRTAIPRAVMGDAVAAYCAEPDPVTFACLARNVIDNALRGVVLPDQIAISDRNGVATLLRSGASGNFRLLEHGSAARGDVVEVPCSTLDAWVDRLQIDLGAVTFVKVDVEGGERRVLLGAPRTLERRHIAWQLEIKPSGLRAAGDEPESLYADLPRWFTHFIDLNRRAPGRRVRPVAELAAALAYLEPAGKTDVLLFSAAAEVA
jgi:FkbM family methyltransferase